VAVTRCKTGAFGADTAGATAVVAHRRRRTWTVVREGWAASQPASERAIERSSDNRTHIHTYNLRAQAPSRQPASPLICIII